MVVARENENNNPSTRNYDKHINEIGGHWEFIFWIRI